MIYLSIVEDARSVYIHPYNRSKILQYVYYTKLSYIAKEIAKIVLTNNMFLDKK